MATVLMQKELVVARKEETSLNVGILSKLQAMPPELSRLVFKENALEKPTQSLFNQLSYYLVCIIDANASVLLPWPLYDTKTERVYRNKLSNFISDYNSKGLLCHVMPSYFVNPGCYKVTLLVFQMSQLAVQKMLTTKMKKESQKKLFTDMTVKYKSADNEFLEQIGKETTLRLSKFSNYLQKRKVSEKIAELFRRKIMDMEMKLNSLNAQKYIDDVVDGFVTKHTLDEATKTELSKIKNIYKPAPFFDNWLISTDKQIDEIESKWSEKVSPFLSISKKTHMQTKSLIARCMKQADKDTYMVEYNHKTDYICTKNIQNQANSQQKYILKNIVKKEKLSFPNLIRGFLIAICVVLKNVKVGDEIYMFNEYLEGGRRKYSEIVLAMTGLRERVLNAEAKLEPSPMSYQQSVRDMPEILPFHDFSELRCTEELQCQALSDSFIPPSMSEHQFNLQGQTRFSFARPQPESRLTTPFCQRPRYDFLNSQISGRVCSYDRPNLNASKDFHGMFAVSQNRQVNETIAECSSGFTKQQILRLLSTKKSSCSKKFRHKTKIPEIMIKKGGLFNESTSSIESNGLFRSYSSPNLYEYKKKRPMSTAGPRKGSVMQEDSLSLLEVSGITALDKDSFSTQPTKLNSFKVNTAMPVSTITPASDRIYNELLRNFEDDLNKFNNTLETPKNNAQIIKKTNFNGTLTEKTETPKNNPQIIKKTSSLEKIINRFKKVRANLLPDMTDEFRSIAEEKDNMNVDSYTVNRVLLPDLLSPSCSVPRHKSDSNYLDKVCTDMDEEVRRKPRESLGTALGVDQTFLDQFDLIE